VPSLKPKADKVSGRDAVAGGLEAIVLVLSAGEKFFVIVGGIKKAPIVAVQVIFDHVVGQTLGQFEPAVIATGVVQAKQAVDEESVVVEVGVNFCRRGLPRGGPVSSQQSAVRRAQVLEDEVRRAG